jgi:D-threo-aldose 1-dehydrogenase
MSGVARDVPAVTVDGVVPLVTRPVGRSVLRLTEVSLGGAQLGNLYRAITDEQAVATVDAAWERGIRYFDTAPHYGLGLSERRLGTALAGRPRSEYVLSTKVGRRLEPLSPPGELDDEGFDVAATHRRVWDFSRDGVLRSLEESLQRLGVDGVDIVYLHDPDEYRREVLQTAYPALEELRAQGVVSAIGAGMNQVAMLADFARHTDMEVLMLAGRYTLLEQSALDDLLRVCERRGVGIVAAGVFNSGLLASRAPADGAKYDYDDAPQALVLAAQRIAEICERHGTSLPAVALAFPLAHPAVLSVCVGARSREQIERNIGLYRLGVPAAVWRELKEEGLLRPDAPVPAGDGTGGSGDQT